MIFALRTSLTSTLSVETEKIIFTISSSTDTVSLNALVNVHVIKSSTVAVSFIFLIGTTLIVSETETFSVAMTSTIFAMSSSPKTESLRESVILLDMESSTDTVSNNRLPNMIFIVSSIVAESFGVEDLIILAIALLSVITESCILIVDLPDMASPTLKESVIVFIIVILIESSMMAESTIPNVTNLTG